jgi:hypothetical protein
MRRRDTLRVGGSAVLLTVAGCIGGDGEEDDSTVDDLSSSWSRDNAVYHPGHVRGMSMLGSARQGRRVVALTYTYTERFWTVSGRRTARVAVESEYNAIHLMASVWDAETGTVLPVDAGLNVTVLQDGEQLRTPVALWPMLSQQMGFHFGDNVGFPEQGEYTLRVDIGETTVRRPDGSETRYDQGGPLDFDFGFRRGTRNRIAVSKEFDSRGERTAVEPMEMIPLSVAPPADGLPGRTVGTATSGDAEFVVAAAEHAGGTYVTVSPRTPHNRFVLPLMSLSMRVDRAGTAAFEGPLPATVGPDRRYHYGRVVGGLEPGDEVTVSVDAPPQAARHAGYETTFLDMSAVTMTVCSLAHAELEGVPERELRVGNVVARGHQSVREQEIAEHEKERPEHLVESTAVFDADRVDERAVGKHRGDCSNTECSKRQSTRERRPGGEGVQVGGVKHRTGQQSVDGPQSDDRGAAGEPLDPPGEPAGDPPSAGQ